MPLRRLLRDLRGGVLEKFQNTDFEEAVMALKSVIKLHRANSITRASQSKSLETYGAYAKATYYARASGGDYWRHRAPAKQLLAQLGAKEVLKPLDPPSLRNVKGTIGNAWRMQSVA
jgi:hypothetical protein